MATPDYSKIWGANSPLAKYEFTEADYLRGWEFIGSMPPARTMFDAWMRKADEKMRWLYDNAFSENSLGGFLFWRLPDTAYFVGEKRALQDGPLDIYLECTIAGRTAKEQMKNLPQGAEVGKTFVDGTATWLVRQFATSTALADHRTKTPLDHPDGSVLKKHLASEVQDAIDAVGGKVSKAGDMMTGALEFSLNKGTVQGKVGNEESYWKLWGSDNRPSVALDICGNGEDAEKAVVLFRRVINGQYTHSVSLINESGDAVFPQTVISQGGFKATGSSGIAFGDHGGGLYMTDDYWIRSVNNKSIYTGGEMKADNGFRGTADNATVAQHITNDAANMRMHWSGQGGQPSWLWGGNEPNNMYVWNPANFRVANADTLGDRSLQWILDQINAANTGIVAGSLQQNGWVKFANGLILQWGFAPEKTEGDTANYYFVYPIAFTQFCVPVATCSTNFNGDSRVPEYSWGEITLQYARYYRRWARFFIVVGV